MNVKLTGEFRPGVEFDVAVRAVHPINGDQDFCVIDIKINDSNYELTEVDGTLTINGFDFQKLIHLYMVEAFPVKDS